jgi:hypothetical protein
MAEESGECLNIEDVYKEPSFNAVDFPGVVRSILCLPMFLHGAPVGFLVLSHSLPSFFHENHIRVLKILGSFIAHLRLLHQGGSIAPSVRPQTPAVQEASEEPDAYSVVLMEFDALDNYGRRIPLHKEGIREIRLQLQRALEARESILFYRERDLLVFMPGVTSEQLPARIRGLREAFRCWQADRAEDQSNTRMNLGFSVCEGEEDLSRTLEVASLVMHPDDDEEPQASTES